MEGSFLQNRVMPAFIDGAPARTVFTRVQRQAAPAEPLLVYLRPADIGAAIERVHRVREEPWSSRNVAFVENSTWARRRNLQGQDAVVRLYQAWEPVAARLYSRYPFPKIMVNEPPARLGGDTGAHLRSRMPIATWRKPGPDAAEPGATPPASQPQDCAE